MLNTLSSIKKQFAESTTITGLVGTRCSLLVELQEAATPFIAYNLREDACITKDGSKELTLVIAIVAATFAELMTIYNAAKTVMDQETTDFRSKFQGGSYPDTAEKDDNYIIELNYSITTK